MSKDSTKTEWRPVPGYPAYEVSRAGQLRNARKKRILKPHVNHGGYYRIGLYGPNGSKTLRVHQLVAEAFIGPCPDGLQVNHIDGDKTNNAAVNLEYVTHQENIRHAVELGKFEGRARGEDWHASKLTEDQVREIHRLAKSHTHTAISERFGIDRSHIGKIIRGDYWEWLA